MRKLIDVFKHENKTSKEGKDYTRFNTSEGWVSAFDDEVIEKLKQAENKNAEVELVESDKGFKNIRNVYNITTETKTQQTEKQDEKLLPKGKYNPTSMYVSYVKDLVVAGKTLDEAIEIIKKAQNSFE